MSDLVWGGIMTFSLLATCVLFLAWKLVRVRAELDSAERHIALIDGEMRSAKAECSALHDQLNRAQNTPWVRCVGCKQMVEERDAVEHLSGVWECSECGDFYCQACGSLECPDCGFCIRGCPWAVKSKQVCKCADKIDQSSPAGSQ
jgi:hypothetical protein